MNLLMERDELHMSQDSMLVDIEDLTRYLYLQIEDLTKHVYLFHETFIFSSPELKAQVSYSDRPLSVVRPSVCL